MTDTQGLDEVTLAPLAKKLNIRPPSLYNHINGLPALLKSLLFMVTNNFIRY